MYEYALGLERLALWPDAALLISSAVFCMLMVLWLDSLGCVWDQWKYVRWPKVNEGQSGSCRANKREGHEGKAPPHARHDDVKKPD